MLKSALPFPAEMFPCTTIIKTMVDQQNPDTGGAKRIKIGEVVAMGSVQDAPVDQTNAYMTRGSNIDSVIYYKNEPQVNPNDVIEWVDEGFMYTVVDYRQEAGFGLLWAVYCARVR